MRNHSILLCILFVCFIINGCNDENVSNAQNKMLEPQLQATRDVSLNDEDFIIKDENNDNKLGDKCENLVTTEKMITMQGETENRAYESYVYENFVVSGGPNIFRIQITSPMIETSKGIRIGDDIEKVIERYGEADFYESNDATGYCMYGHEAKFVLFYFDSSKKVTSISIELA